MSYNNVYLFPPLSWVMLNLKVSCRICDSGWGTLEFFNGLQKFFTRFDTVKIDIKAGKFYFILGKVEFVWALYDAFSTTEI